MSGNSILYGVIEEYGWTNRAEEIYGHNEKIISNLPLADPWPPLSKEMFSITKNNDLNGPNLAVKGRTIHFAASLNGGIDWDWEEWKTKFENLLLNLYWRRVHVHLQTEYCGLKSFTWQIDLNKWSINENPIPSIKKEYWNFENINNWEVSEE